MRWLGRAFEPARRRGSLLRPLNPPLRWHERRYPQLSMDMHGFARVCTGLTPPSLARDPTCSTPQPQISNEFTNPVPSPLRMDSVWANIPRTKCGARSEQEPNTQQAPNVPRTPKRTEQSHRCNLKPQVLAHARTPERVRCGRFQARQHRAPTF